jgi:microcin C transport system ATP-binding protein
MKAGKVVEFGPTMKILESPDQPYTQALMAAAFDLKADESGIVGQ